MRKQLCMALAKYRDRPLTSEVAVQLVRELFPSNGIDLEALGRQQCGSLTFQAELLRDIELEMHLLHLAHYAETEQHRHGLPMDADYPAMLAEEAAGTMVQFTARAGRELVGNCRMYLRVSRHTGTRFAQEDTLYLLPEHRRGRNAVRFVQFVLQALAGLGYREVRADVKHSNPQAGRLMRHCGFAPVATQYVFIAKDPDHATTL